MSFQMIHMEIAYRLLASFPQIGHPAEFILGSVAPDAVHMNPHFDVNTKVKSHLYEDCGPWGDTQDSGQWRRNIRAYFERGVVSEAEPARRDLALGICVHCLTDHWNDIRIWKEAQRVYLPTMAFAEFRENYYREYRCIDWWLYQNGKNTAEICRLLADAVCFSAEGLVDGAELERLKKHLLCEQYDVDTVDITRNRFLTIERIGEFMAFTVDDIRKRLMRWSAAI